MQYPGNCASPKDVALWMKTIAEEEYGLPGILPVMCSCVEITSAWTSEGCVEDVSGYLSAQDHDSLGYFQQRPSQGWGTPEQLVDADYALRAFLKAAKGIEDDSPADTPEQLGAWCQAVQRSAEPEKYATKGYPMAKKLLEQSATVTDWPERKIATSADGWALDLETNAWIKGEPNADWKTDGSGWLYKIQPAKPEEWKWPEANEPVGYIGDGSYQDYHPTRYTWREDVAEVARYLVDNYDCWVNTYVDHPPGWGLDTTSLDIWGPGGRGDQVNDSGDAGFWDVFNNGKPPWVRWCIRDGWIWDDYNGWRAYWDTDPWSDAGHYQHRHYTFA